MAGRRGCVNSLWSGAERVRIGERLKATLAGVLELELLRCKQLEMVDGALERRETPAAEGGSTEEDSGQSAATSRGQQVVCTSETTVSPCQSSPEDNCSSGGDGILSGRAGDLRWSTLSWDAPSELLSPPTPDASGTHLDSDSRPSSGFYSVSGSSLSDSCYSVSSEAAHGCSATQARPQKEQALVSDNSDIVWLEGAVQEQHPIVDVETVEGATVPVSDDVKVTGLNFLSDMCSDFSQAWISSLQPILDPTAPASTPSKDKTPLLDPRYCTDLVSRRTKEVYSYPSPLHAVALQSPLFTSQSPDQSASQSPEEASTNDGRDSHSDQRQIAEPPRSKAVISCTQLEKYIHRLAHQYNSRAHSSASDLTLHSAITPRGLCTPGKSHGSTQSLSTVPGGSITPCKSLLGNSARVSLSTTGKKATRNSINLGNLPSATGEDLNINLHLNLNLNLAPGLKSSRELTDNQNNCGTLGGDLAGAATTSVPSSAPALRARPRISTCPSSLSHRSSLEVSSSHGAGPGFGSTAFSRSLDWSSGGPSDPGLSVFGASCGSAPGSQRSSLIQESSLSSRLSEDCHVVGEISRLSGLSRSVVVGLMEQGVELDVECFQAHGETKLQRKSHLTAQTEASNCSRQADLSPQRPVQLSLSVTHSPQSQASTTPPRSLSSSPMHPYQSIQVPSQYYPSHCQYQQVSSTSDPPSSTASSPASRPTQRGRSPPRPLQQSPMTATPLTVFRRDAPFQCSLPRTITRNSTLEHGAIQPRGGSLRQSMGGSGGGSGWSRAEGEGLYKGKHASHRLIRAATVSSYGKSEDYSDGWAIERREQMVTPKKSTNKFSRGFDRNALGNESGTDRQDMDRFDYGYGWRRNSVGSWDKDHRRLRAASSGQDRKPKAENSPTIFKKKVKNEGERRSSSLRPSRRALFRSESQGLLVPQNYTEEPKKRPHWVSSFDVGRGDISTSKNERGRLLRAKEEEKRLSSTASLFNLSRSQSLEGSSHSLSPLSSPSFSPSPPHRPPLQRSRSLRDLGRKVFGSMRSLSLKRKPSKK
ncbi:uncharacterized protein ACB058_012202 [Synchiropus picturatus]